MQWQLPRPGVLVSVSGDDDSREEMSEEVPHKPPLSSIGEGEERGPVVVEAARGEESVVVYVLPGALRGRR